MPAPALTALTAPRADCYEPLKQAHQTALTHTAGGTRRSPRLRGVLFLPLAQRAGSVGRSGKATGKDLD